MGNIAGFRLNPDKDADIIQDLGKYKDRTARIKEVYRKVMALEKQGFNIATEVVVSQPRDSKPLVWNFPTEPSVKPVTPIDTSEKPKGSLKNNILNNGF